MKLTLTSLLVLSALLLVSCQKNENEPQGQAAQPVQPAQPAQPVQPVQQIHAGADVHTAVVQEVIQASTYTYLKVKEDDRDYWIAVTKREIEPGKTISFTGGLEMKNFESQDLKRTFDTIYLVSQIDSNEPSLPAGHPSIDMAHGIKPVIDKKEISVEPVEGGITIGKLFSNKDSYANKKVLIKGQVTKVNPAIMGRNWIHLQDGTGDSGSYDLTVTTQDEVKVGDVVTFEGTIALNRDFGAGYTYDVIMEDAKQQAK